jgi:Tesmin/TSO1-like CXC domain, cysteine-rich domain
MEDSTSSSRPEVCSQHPAADNASNINHKQVNHRTFGQIDSTINPNDAGLAKTSLQTTIRPTPANLRNVQDTRTLENKENLLADDDVIYVGESSTLPNAYFPFQPVQPHGYYRHDGSDPRMPPPIYPPMMAYANSRTFSDISLPFPSLNASKSFGPNGALERKDIPSPTEQLISYPSMGQGYMPYFPQFHTPNYIDTEHYFHKPHAKDSQNVRSGNEYENSGSNMVTINDLDIAASALLDLTPAITRDDQLNNTLPPQKRDNYYANNPSGLYDVEQTNSRQKRLPTSQATSCNNDVARTTHFQNTKAQVDIRAQELLKDIPLTLLACKCKSTYCLKLYCTCFQAGAFCDDIVCRCRGCKNTAEYSLPRGSRTLAIYEILHRRIDAFDSRQRKQSGNGCCCKKSK